MKEQSTELQFFLTVRSKKFKKKFAPINAYKLVDICVIFVYGVDSPRQFSHFDVFHAWINIFLLSAVFVMGAIIVYYVRRFAGVRRIDFMVGFLEVFTVVFVGGNIRYRHHLERLFFAAALIMSFFLVSICLADYSMHSVLREPLKIDTFEKLAKQNITFYFDTQLKNDKLFFDAILR